MAVIARLDLITQYAAPFEIRNSRLWNTGCPAFAEHDDLRFGRASLQLPGNASRTHTIVIARLDLITQYAAPFEIYHSRLWNTGCAAFAEHDERTHSSRRRHSPHNSYLTALVGRPS